MVQSWQDIFNRAQETLAVWQHYSSCFTERGRTLLQRNAPSVRLVGCKGMPRS
jgi:hypothetical protein